MEILDGNPAGTSAHLGDSRVKNILVVNDDGIEAPGLKALVAAILARNADSSKPFTFDVRVFAPAEEQSAKSHSITVHGNIVVKVHHFQEPALAAVKAKKVYGTPADCSKLALNPQVFGTEFMPNIVLSGINRGNNAGFNVQYSGTVAAATEATLLGFTGNYSAEVC
eukprot:TRINITY_DN4405_c0_g1_i2.p1 TRINITY_DN4405_c0_g1~~TRINITY_DN4405_c0_g1_i2.p1  ORF type:complete len:167 (+),score=13.36 TRINITY_DN4405_c0_g1_i2:90-590(+)